MVEKDQTYGSTQGLSRQDNRSMTHHEGVKGLFRAKDERHPIGVGERLSLDTIFASDCNADLCRHDIGVPNEVEGFFVRKSEKAERNSSSSLAKYTCRAAVSSQRSWLLTMRFSNFSVSMVPRSIHIRFLENVTMLKHAPSLQ